MNVSELIEELKKLDPNLQVVAQDGMDPSDYAIVNGVTESNSVYVPLEKGPFAVINS